MQTQFITGGTPSPTTLQYTTRNMWGSFYTSILVLTLVLVSTWLNAALAAPVCSSGGAPTTPANMKATILLAPDRVVGGGAYPPLANVSSPGQTLSCTGVPANKDFYITATGLMSIPNTAYTVLKISPTEVRSTYDLNPPGYKVKLGDTPPINPNSSRDQTFTGVRASNPMVLSCSGTSTVSRVGEVTNNQGLGIALLKCRTTPEGTLYVSFTNAAYTIYQASPDGAVGLFSSGSQEQPVGAYTANSAAATNTDYPWAIGTNVWIANTLSEATFINNGNRPPSNTRCARDGSTNNPIFSAAACGFYDTTALLIIPSSSQPAAPTACSVDINGATNASVSWEPPIPSSAFTGVGDPIASAMPLAIHLSCTGPGASSLSQILLTARGSASRQDARRFESTNGSVDFSLKTTQSNKIIAPNLVSSLSAGDGVQYSNISGPVVGSVALSVTPIMASAMPIPGRADARIIFDVYAN